MSSAMEAFNAVFNARDKAKGRAPTRGFVRVPGMTDKEYRMSVRKAHMMGDKGLVCGGDHKAKVSMPFLVTRNWTKVTCGKCLRLRK